MDWYSYDNSATTPSLKRMAAMYDAGRVKRLHGRATVAEHPISSHVYGTLVLAVELSALNDVRLEKVMLALLYHDAAELVTGDVPAPVKRENPLLAQTLQQLEQRWERKMGLRLPDDLTQLEKQLVKACDTLDLAFNVLHERTMGNRSTWVGRVFQNCMSYLEAQKDVSGVADVKRYLMLAFMYNKESES